MLKRADRIIVSSPALLEHSTLLRRYRSKCEVIPFGYNPSHDIKPPTEEGNYYICVGRHISYKGIETLIRAWPELDCKLVLIGNGQLLNRHKALSDRLDNGDKIEFVEFADDASVTWHIAGCRALILPSVAPNEAFGLVQIEAMSLGKPIINTRLGSGVPWVARDGMEAITVTPGNAREIHAAVNRMEGDEGLRQRLGEGARLRWQQEFGFDQFTRRTIDLYCHVLTEKQISHPLADTTTPPIASDQPVKN
jgi:rhamnosyl/mannosyltransferase